MGEHLIAPELLIPEVCNVLWKRRNRGDIDDEQAGRARNLLQRFVDDFVPMLNLFGRAYELAMVLAHPAYDCFYIALAEANNAVMVTADARLVARLSGTTFGPRIRLLGNV
jgi:predicted nucleic acid-binding protein